MNYNFKYIIEHDDNMFRKILFAFAGEPLLNYDQFKEKWSPYHKRY